VKTQTYHKDTPRPWLRCVIMGVSEKKKGQARTNHEHYSPQKRKIERHQDITVQRSKIITLRTAYSWFLKIRTTLSNSLSVFIYLFRNECFCRLVVWVPGYISRDPKFDSRRYQILWEVVGLELGPFGLLRITEELLEWKSRGSGSTKSRLTAMGFCCANHATPSISKSWN
jgi:hypothetical protein